MRGQRGDDQLCEGQRMNISIPMSRAELAQELQELADYWPLTVDELTVNKPYPLVPTLSPGCTVYVHWWVSRSVH